MLRGDLVASGFRVIATGGTARMLDEAGIPVRTVRKVLEGRPHIVDAIKSGEVDLVFNTTEGATAMRDSYSLRREALNRRVPYFTTLAGARAAVRAMGALRTARLEVAPLQSYFGGPF